MHVVKRMLAIHQRGAGGNSELCYFEFSAVDAHFWGFANHRSGKHIRDSLFESNSKVDRPTFGTASPRLPHGFLNLWISP